jgi:hypothetical protein
MTRMSTTAQDTSSSSGLSPWTRRRRFAPVALALVAALLLGLWLGRFLPAQARWETMDAELYREGDVVVFVDDAGTGRFVLESSVPEWIDESGNLHTGGMPECLVIPDADSRPSSELALADVRFAWVEARVEGSRSPVVVRVDCRQ